MRPPRHRHRCSTLFSVALLGAFSGLALLRGQDAFRSNFEISTPADNPWAGVNSAGNFELISGQQLAVNDDGHVVSMPAGASVAVGDLNGDGLPDLVIADTHGFFWFFANSGQPGKPKFTHGEIMPVWFGASSSDPSFTQGGADNVIPRIQLVNLSGDNGLLDLVVGTYTGRLYYLRNHGDERHALFGVTPSQLAKLAIPTRRDGMLWCNYLSPFLYDWSGRGDLDLILGDGTYAANSIYFLANQGTRDQPVFTEDKTTRIIPGLGREHLTPQVIDWNNDGRPDIISGERTGVIDLFLNTSPPDSSVPTFDAGQHLTIGGRDTFTGMTVPTVCDLTGNKLPNLIITDSADEFLYAENTGKPGAPEFKTLVPFAGTNPYPKILLPVDWKLTSPYGVPYELLVCTNAKVQPDFVPPPGTPFKNALRYYVYPVKNNYFLHPYYPLADPLFDDIHSIGYKNALSLKENVHYTLSFWIRTTGEVHDLNWHMNGYRIDNGDDHEEVLTQGSVDGGTSWHQFEDHVSFTFKNHPEQPKKQGTGTVYLFIKFGGQGEIYLDDVRVSAEADENQ